MIVMAHQAGARSIGAGRWRVAVETPPGSSPIALGGEPVVARPADPATPHARVEVASAGSPAARGRCELVLALEAPVDPGKVAVYELRGGADSGWTARIELDPGWEEPRPAKRRAGDGAPRADIDYTARDFAALRQMMLRVIGERVPAPLADHPVAQSTAVVEELAYLGDALSYHQDALMTEAYLATARRRVSVARHAALLDYELFEGRTARAWVRVEADEPRTMRAGTKLAAGSVRFETLDDVALWPQPPVLPLAGTHHGAARLAPGATQATVRAAPGAVDAGDLVLIEPASLKGRAIGHVVRLAGVTAAGSEGGDPLTLLEWLPADAMPADPLLTSRPLCIRVGNLVLAEEGEWRPWTPLPSPLHGERYRPQLPHRHTAFSARRPALDEPASAAEMLVPSGATRPQVELRERIGGEVRHWHARPTLFASGPIATDFVVEIGDRGEAALRFGDNANGLRPPPGAQFELRQRVGGGAAGNVAAGEITHVVDGAVPVTAVSNPSPARGGDDPEGLTSARLAAPEAFRKTERVVEPEDYVEQARAVAGVVDAAASLTSTGSWPIAVVYLHTGAWHGREGRVPRQVRRRLAARQPAGVALAVRPAVPLPVSIELEVVLAGGWDESAAAAAIDRALRSSFLAPDRFGFGDALHRSDVLTTIAAVPGVANVSVLRFERYGEYRRDAAETIQPPFGHIVRIDNDGARPQDGVIVYTIRGPA